MPALLGELLEFLRIPSVSAGRRRPDALLEAARWVRDYLSGAGRAELVEVDREAPLVVAELGPDDAPPVLVYGHYDVQDPGDAAQWTSDPFEPALRDGRVYARGAADDKGNMLPLLAAARDLAAQGELRLRVTALVEGGEETGSTAACRWLRERAGDFAAAIAFDTTMADERTPLLCVGARGLVMLGVSVRVAERDLHSGIYGGVAENAIHLLARAIDRLVEQTADGGAPLLADDVEPPSELERAAWQRLRAGQQLLAAAGGRAADPARLARFWELTTARPSLDVHCFEAGAPRTIVPATASATLSARLVPRQRPDSVADAIERALRGFLPDHVELAVEGVASADPVRFDPQHPVLAAARKALARACANRPIVARTGGTLPVLGELAAHRVPTVFTGFALEEDAVHGADESFRVEALELGYRAARELLRELAATLRSGE